MADRLDLNTRGIRLYAGRLYNHDYLWFSSFEISKTAATFPLIHNYALSYAVSGYSYGIYVGSAPRYEEDLAAMPAYATPARPEGVVSRTRFTQNAVNSKTLRTGEKKIYPYLRSINTPELGWRLVLDPVWRGSAMGSVPSGFVFYLFAREGFRPPPVVRLGKKGCPIRFEWEEIASAVAVLTESAVHPTHAVNPLDVQGEILSYDPLPIPPHLIFRTAEIRKDWFVFAGEHRVLVPRRLTLTGPVTTEPQGVTKTAQTRRKRNA